MITSGIFPAGRSVFRENKHKKTAGGQAGRMTEWQDDRMVKTFKIRDSGASQKFIPDKIFYSPKLHFLIPEGALCHVIMDSWQHQ